MIRELQDVNGDILTEGDAIGQRLVSQFEEFGKKGVSAFHATVLDVIPEILTNMDNDSLSEIPSATEISCAAWDLDPSSVPGPDDFPGVFYTTCWDMVGNDIMLAKWVIIDLLLFDPSSLLLRLVSEEQAAFQKGPLDASISSFHFLSELNLNYNQNLSSTVPSSLVNLTSLTVFSIVDCGFHGVFPSNVFLQPNLTLIHLSGNPLLSVQLPEFPEVNNSSLQYLGARGTKFQGQFPSSVGNLKFLKILYLGNCNFSGALPPSLANLSHVTELDLSGNSFSGQIPSFFPDFLRDIKSLSYLDLSSNRIDGAIPKWIWQLQNLSYLDLSNNSLTGLELPLPPTNHSFNIEYLYLDSNKIQHCLPTAPCSSQTFNQSNSDQFVSPILGNLTSLLSKARIFSISVNKLTGKIPFSICNASNLKYLDLSHNQLSGPIPTCLGSSNLKLLSLTVNKLAGNIPFSLCNASNLEFLDLSFNQLSGIIPTGLGNSNLLGVLSVESNNLVGNIPFSICNASNLYLLKLSDNPLSGTIPTCLGSSNLEVLYLENNKLHGPIPPILFRSGCRLHSLKLNGNMLQGQVPRSLANCKKLVVLDIGDNQLNDSFPYWLENLSQLSVLIMRSNNFVVDIVDKGLHISQFHIATTFTTVDLSNNKFNGEIPDAMGNLKSLMLLNLSGNSLMGRIPSSLENLSNLESLDLSRNNLSGQIPSQLTSLTFLSILNLSDNNLVGIIPQGKQFDTFSNTFYEGNTGLCGFPLSRKCGITDGALPPILTLQQEEDSTPLLDWKFLVAGYCSGLIVGLVIGQQFFWRNNRFTAFCLRIRGSKKRKGLKRKHNIRKK
ncbi:receptor-like protein Cf-9 [Macadamia integrifolia]|uniref:receptor-like protein Cf-9 n=1 Tax=Macadamia integrifolia TaxID=60698 RepID=UPI001C52B217|nr:receptor-like protein Cf-9 [Macadamia integrifolia]